LAPAELARLTADYQAKVAAWEKTVFPADPENTGLAQGWAKPDFDDSAWRPMPLPVLWQTRGLEFNGTIWFRRAIEVPAAWAGHDLALNLGAIDDFDRTYFNGQPVGATGAETTGAYQVRRRYVVPGKLVHPGRNVIAVRVFDRFGQGGWSGPARLMAAGPTDAEGGLPLAGDWRYAVEHEIPLVSGDVYQTAPAVPPGISTQSNAATLFNGMIAPLVPYGIRGAIWYQGEANVDEAASYRARFTAMIRDWRARWGEGDFPFFFVQLASFRATPGWPLLREAQAQTLIEPATGMAVTLDIGNPTDIHPRNKQDVGHRLALLARAQVYGEPSLETAGPTLERTEVRGKEVRVHLSHAGGLRARGGAAVVTGFALAGADGVYHPAAARIDGSGVIVSSDAVPAPHTVRYAWADCPTANLENAAGLPAAPFRTDGY
jgi:sialate O-acetylesterase